MKRKYLSGQDPGFRGQAHPMMFISPQRADQLLAGTGSSLADLESRTEKLKPGEFYASNPGASVRMVINLMERADLREPYYHVIGFIPGSGSKMPSGNGDGLDNNVIIISAYYDGLGVGPDGTLYPGANDNASGVGAMLEIARALKMSPYPPKKTILFVAWAGGERYEGLSIENVMNAKAGFSKLNVETVIELSGVGFGSGKEIAFGEGSSYRLTELFTAAAEKIGIDTTVRGRGPHYQQYTANGFGGRSALSIYLSWNGSDSSAHLPEDTIDTIDPNKLDKIGRTVLLAVSVLSREVEY
jgi:hypothetical protein